MGEQCSHVTVFIMGAVKLLLCPLYRLNFVIHAHVQEETVYKQIKVCVLFLAIVCIQGETQGVPFMDKWRPIYKSRFGGQGLLWKAVSKLSYPHL